MAVSFAAVLLIGLVPVLSQDGMGEPGGEGEIDMEKAWEELSKPREQHKALAEMAGEWEITGKAYKMGPEGKPIEQEMKGTSTCKLIHDRFLIEEMTTECEGKVSSGTGFMGYDNDAGEYQACYVGEWGTGMQIYRGKASEDGKTVNLAAEYSVKTFGDLKIKERMVSTQKSKDESTFTMYITFGDKPEEKMMEMTYKRKK
jgi:hypothetical protein